MLALHLQGRILGSQLITQCVHLGIDGRPVSHHLRGLLLQLLQSLLGDFQFRANRISLLEGGVKGSTE